MSLTSLPAHRLAQEISERRLSPVEVVEAFLAQINRNETDLNAFTEVYAESALTAAQAAERAISSGHSVGPLHGVPVVLKDNIEIKGHPTSNGLKIAGDRLSNRNATVVSRLVSKGLIILGKTQLPELSLDGWGFNYDRGAPKNPWDTRNGVLPGGSSSGSAVAVAAGMAPWAIGTDTGGSVRVPSSFCGQTGLKTTVGSVSRFGVIELSRDLDSVGPIAKCAQDAALLFEAISGPDENDPSTLCVARPRNALVQSPSLRGLTFSAIPDKEREVASTEVLKSYDEALGVLARLGAEIISSPLPIGFSELGMAFITSVCSEVYAAHRQMVEESPLHLSDNVKAKVEFGRSIAAWDYHATQHKRAGWKKVFAELFQGVDAIITPTTPTTALTPSAVEALSRAGPGHPLGFGPGYYTRFVNVLDLCAISVPSGFSAAGLPFGLQIVCKGLGEGTAIRVAAAYQSATNWHDLQSTAHERPHP